MSPFLQLLLGGACFVIIVAGMQAAASILNSFFLGLLIAIATTPLLGWLRRRGIPTGWALLLTVLVVVATGITLLAFLGLSVSELLQILPTYEDRIASLRDSSRDFLTATGIDIGQTFDLDSLQPGTLVKLIAQFLQRIGRAISESLLLIFIVAFMLLEGMGFPLKLQKGLSPNSLLSNQFAAFAQSIRSYIWITTWTGGLTAIVDFLILSLLGVDLALLWGVLFFLLNFIPAVGFLLAVIPPMFLGLLEFGWGKSLQIFFLCWLVDNIVDKGIKPRFMQRSLDLSLLAIILSVIFWSWVLGPLGALLAIPLTMMIKTVILESSEQTRLLANLLSGDVSENASTAPPESEDQF